MLCECEALRDEVVVNYGKGALGEEVRGDVEVAGGSGAGCEGCLGEAMVWDVLEGGGEDGGLGGVEGGRGVVFVGVVRATAMRFCVGGSIFWTLRPCGETYWRGRSLVMVEVIGELVDKSSTGQWCGHGE